MQQGIKEALDESNQEEVTLIFLVVLGCFALAQHGQQRREIQVFFVFLGGKKREI